GLVDADAQSEEAAIVTLAVEIAARVAVLAGQQSRAAERPGPLDVEDGVAVADRTAAPGDEGGNGRRRQRRRHCDRGPDPGHTAPPRSDTRESLSIDPPRQTRSLASNHLARSPVSLGMSIYWSLKWSAHSSRESRHSHTDESLNLEAYFA